MTRSSLMLVFLGVLSLSAAGAWGQETVPQAVSPGASRQISLIADRCPTFSWTLVADARSYELAVFEVDEELLTPEASQPEGREPLFRVTVPGTAVSWTPAMDRCLEAGGQYAWFVRALADQAGEWSEAKLFEVAAGPSIAEVKAALRVLQRYRAARARERSEADAPAAVERPRRRPEGRPQRPGERPSVAAKARSGGLAAGEKRPRPEEGLRSESLGRPGVESPAFPSLTAVTAQAAAPTLGTPSLTVDQQIHLGPQSSFFKDGELFLWSDGADGRNIALGRKALSQNTTGNRNIAIGYRALRQNTSGWTNIAIGDWALYSNSTGGGNTAVGAGALVSNTSGSVNTASGERALQWNNTGSGNTSVGYSALRFNESGSQNSAMGDRALGNNVASRNTAIGAFALYSNTTGEENTAAGTYALRSNTEGDQNTASGYKALQANISGWKNTASGSKALLHNTVGDYNTAFGYGALAANSSGFGNVAVGPWAVWDAGASWGNTGVGVSALTNLQSGLRNVAIGYDAGYDLGNGSDNIFIANEGVGGDDGKIRIGTQGTQTETFIAGIWGNDVLGGSTVTVTASGELGVLVSSRRAKDDIRDMDGASGAVLALRPVTFRYKKQLVQGPRPLEFGLIAEEVAEIYPDLVTYDEAGKPFAVRYQVLIPMLLNELQRQEGVLADQRRELASLRARLARLEISGAPSGRQVP